MVFKENGCLLQAEESIDGKCVFDMFRRVEESEKSAMSALILFRLP